MGKKNRVRLRPVPDPMLMSVEKDLDLAGPALSSSLASVQKKIDISGQEALHDAPLDVDGHTIGSLE